MGSLVQFIPFILIFVLMYFLILKPQADEKAAHDALVASLAKDDRVVTNGGIHGRVISVDDRTVVLEIAERTRITLDKHVVARRIEDAA